MYSIFFKKKAENIETSHIYLKWQVFYILTFSPQLSFKTETTYLKI